MIRHSTCTGRTFSTSSIHREVIQAQGHTGSNQNCTVSRSAGCVMTAPTAITLRAFPDSRVPAAEQDGGQGKGQGGVAAEHREPGPWRKRVVAEERQIGVADLRVPHRGALDREG